MTSRFKEYLISFIVSVCFVVIVTGCAGGSEVALTSDTVQHAIDFATTRLKQTAIQYGDSILFPRSTSDDGKWKTVPPRDWTSGFFPGCLWYMSDLKHDSMFQELAERWTVGLTEQQYLTQTHDIGFIIFNSFGKGYEFTNNESYKPIILQAAHSLMTRYNPKVGCIKSWDGRKWGYPVIIDNMMNLELLLWSSRNGGTQEMYDAAVSHARQTAKNHFRSDGSTYHVVDYDTLTGKVIAKETHQGFANESVWARGQAWAIYGFTMAYRYTHEPEFLEAATKSANWFIDHLPVDHVPYWDFMSPNIPNDEKDVSAAAIAGSALLELKNYTDNPAQKSKFEKSAFEIINTLCSSSYLAEGTNSCAILNHAVGNHPKDSEIDVSLIYADYYFLEALSRLTVINSKHGDAIK
ncbi:MAG: glycoside hydrolase family 88 protein [Ignavibacteriales bacterium]|nr:glycoside hydrolase family 88 protein [Ignavibacteriales bacterium]